MCIYTERRVGEVVLCLVAQAQSCLTLYDPMDCSPLGSFVHGNSPGKITGSVLPFCSPGDLPDPGIKPRSPESPEEQVVSLLLSHWGSQIST